MFGFVNTVMEYMKILLITREECSRTCVFLQSFATYGEEEISRRDNFVSDTYDVLIPQFNRHNSDRGYNDSQLNRRSNYSSRSACPQGKDGPYINRNNLNFASRSIGSHALDLNVG